MGRREYASFGVELAKAKATGNTLEGYASVFNYPIETVESYLYGTTTYIRPKAFTKTIAENRDSIQSLFNHGHDPRFGELPIGVPKVMQQDEHGLWVEVELHDGPSNEDIKAALRSGSLRSMSIAFEATQDDYNEDRTERNIRQVRLYEFGPVTFPANAAATATLHSLPILTEHWDGAAALRACSSASEFRSIAFERKNDSDPDTAAHWGLPHHARPGAGPDPQGVSAALGALAGGRVSGPSDMPESTFVMSNDSIRSHLTGHQGSSDSIDRSTSDEAAASEALDRLTRDKLTLAHADDIRWRAEQDADIERMKKWAQRRN